ncbi:MAG: murein transglycosylase A [Crocinitomicaceae bacterium]|nr:murein transglycosylase A [Flavobacteriales bacterium]NQZ34655.1 murein transglycosylase A [Crocinitomicaceae bacterium]
MRILLLSNFLFLSSLLFAQNDGVAKINLSNSPGLGSGYEYENNGKLDSLTVMSRVFEKDTVLTKVLIENTAQLSRALRVNMAYLNKKGSGQASRQNSLRYNYQQLRKVNQLLQTEESDSFDLTGLDLHKIWGEDKMGNVHFTSYYIPIIEVSNVKDSVYKYPIYKKPSSSYLQGLSRVQIDQQKLLNGKNLEIAYAKNYFDVFSMQVQGSGYVEFSDGTKKLFSYGGKNNKPYYSIGRYLIDAGHIPKDEISMQSIKSWFEANPDSLSILMKNASYVYFRESYNEPSGAAGVPLVDFVSIASDFKYLPKGALILGEVPVLDSGGNFLRHEYRILIVHDTGGAIKGAGHVDLYAGVGPVAGEYAGRMKHYGRLWLILP